MRKKPSGTPLNGSRKSDQNLATLKSLRSTTAQAIILAPLSSQSTESLLSTAHITLAMARPSRKECGLAAEIGSRSLMQTERTLLKSFPHLRNTLANTTWWEALQEGTFRLH